MNNGNGLRVFVSSTFIDLQDHRKAICDIIRQFGATDIAMEHLGARDERPVKECVRLARESCDAFVGVYAHRYGHIPSRHRKSITELEYEAASAARVRRYVYLLNKSVPWKPDFVDSGASAKKLQGFIGRLKTEHVCKEFADKHELSAFVAADLARDFAFKVYHKVDAAQGKRPRSPTSVKSWNAERTRIYSEARNIFIAHTLRPSKEPNQWYDIAIYLVFHRSNTPAHSRIDLSDVLQADFFLGPYFGNRPFVVSNRGGNLGIVVSAWGPFLCVCRITFRDGTTTMINRYIDFEMGDQNR